MVAYCPICLHKDGVLIDILRKIDSEDVLIESKAQEDGTVVPAKWDVLLHRKDLPCLSKFCFSGHTARIFTTQLYEAVEIIRPSQSNKTCTKAIYLVNAIQTMNTSANSLSCDLGNDGIIIRVGVPHGLNEAETSITCILAILVVTDLVYHEQHIDLLGDQN